MGVRIEVEGKDVLPLDSLTEFQGNLKELSKENYEKFKKDILSLGFISPIHVWRAGKDNFCLDGHQRIRTLKKMREEGIEIPSIPVVYVQAKDKKEAKKKILSLTSQFGKITGEGLYEFINEAGIDFADVKNEFSFHEINFDKFEKEYYDSYDEADGEDETPALRKTSIKHGDLFLLGNHRLYCGDATKTKDVEALMQNEKADVVFTDPPYNVAYSGRGKNNLGTIENDDMSDAKFDSFIEAVFESYHFAMKDFAPIYVCHPDSKSGPKISFEVQFAKHFHKSATCIWVKQSAGMGWQDYRAQHEPILYGWKKGPKKGSHYFLENREKTTVWNIGRDAQASYVHPTQKPVALPQEALINSSRPGSLVLDFFGGSGSTLIASEKTQRKCLTMELDPQYCQVIIDRWEQFTELKAVKYTEKEKPVATLRQRGVRNAQRKKVRG